MFILYIQTYIDIYTYVYLVYLYVYIIHTYVQIYTHLPTTLLKDPEGSTKLKEFGFCDFINENIMHCTKQTEHNARLGGAYNDR